MILIVVGEKSIFFPIHEEFCSANSIRKPPYCGSKKRMFRGISRQCRKSKKDIAETAKTIGSAEASPRRAPIGECCFEFARRKYEERNVFPIGERAEFFFCYLIFCRTHI